MMSKDIETLKSYVKKQKNRRSLLKNGKKLAKYALCTFLVSAAYVSSPAHADTAQNGKTLHVVITSLPPYVTLGADGHLQGIDGALFNKAAQELHIKYSVTVTNWDGMLAAVQSGRADIAVSDVAWTKARAQTGLFTDPSYYLPELIAERDGLDIQTVNQLSGHTVGAINGQSYVDPLTSVPGVHLRLYQDTASLLSDLSAGRIDAAFMDPLVMVYMKKVRPDLHFNVKPLTPPTMAEIAANPKMALFGPQMIGWYVRPGNQPLVDELNKVIHQFWQEKTNAAAIRAVGVTDVKPFLDPGPAWLKIYETQRRGLDRPDSWVAPGDSMSGSGQ